MDIREAVYSLWLSLAKQVFFIHWGLRVLFRGEVVRGEVVSWLVLSSIQLRLDDE